MKRVCWGLSAVIAAAILFTIIKFSVMIRAARREHQAGLVSIDVVSFARHHLFTFTALTIGVVIFVLTFAMVRFIQRKWLKFM